MVIWLNSPCIDYEAMHFPISLVLQSIPLNLSWVHDFRNVSSQFQGVDSGQNRKRGRGSSRKKGEEHIVFTPASISILKQSSGVRLHIVVYSIKH